MTPDSPLRVAMVGCGAIAYSHLSALTTMSTARCTVLFDTDRARAEATRAQHRLNAEIVSSLADIPGRADAAIVAVPNIHHAPISIELLTAGVHVLCEKPLATSVADAERMVEVAANHQRVLTCGLIRRFWGSTALIDDALRRRLVGRPLRCEVREAVYTWPYNRVVFDRGISGGGVLIDTGAHVIDLLARLFGPLELVDYTDDARGGIDANAFVTLRCATDAGPVTADLVLGRAVRIRNVMRIVCENGVIEAELHQRNAITVTFHDNRVPYVLAAASQPIDPFVLQLQNLVDAIRKDAPAEAPGTDTLPTLRLIDTCYRTRRDAAEPWTPATRGASGAKRPSRRRKILVTGAAGMIGSRLVELWARDGDVSNFRCLVRSYRTAARIMRFPIDVVEGDLRDRRSLRAALDGCDAVVHLGVGDDAAEETDSIADAAREAGVARFVHMSSAAVYGFGLPARIEQLQEETALRRTGESYPDQKVRAEETIQRAVRRGLPAVMLRPHVVYGPGMRWSSELITLLGRGEIAILEDGGWCNLIYVDDLVAAVGCALDADTGVGEAFFVTDNEPVRWSEYITAHARLLGVDPPVVARRDVFVDRRGIRNRVRASLGPLMPVLRSNEFRSFVLQSPLMQATALRAYLGLRRLPRVKARLDRLRSAPGGPPPASRKAPHDVWNRLQTSEARLSGARAERVLDFRAAVPFAEGLERTVRWFERYGFLPSGRERP